MFEQNVKKIAYGFLIGLCLLVTSQLHALDQVFRTRVLGFYLGGQATWSPYKTYGSLYFNFQRGARLEVMTPQDELRIFQRLLSQFYRPRYFLFQATVYPAATVSSFTETDYPRQFKKFTVYDDLNLLRSVGSGYEEPYALSVFLGNIIFFTRQQLTENTLPASRQTGSALAGILVSGGHWHIQDNIRIDDKWYEFQFMLTGKYSEPRLQRVGWDVRLGCRLHANELISDVALIGFRRDHSDWRYRGWSLRRNIEFKYTGYLPIGADAHELPLFVRHLWVVTKKYPVRFWKYDLFLKMGVGILWEHLKRYDREHHTFDNYATSNLTWLLQPNVEF